MNNVMYEVCVRGKDFRTISFLKEEKAALDFANIGNASLDRDCIGESGVWISVALDEDGKPALSMECEGNDGRNAVIGLVSDDIFVTVNRLSGDYDLIDRVYGVRRLEDEASWFGTQAEMEREAC